jgi:hypothetical protein
LLPNFSGRLLVFSLPLIALAGAIASYSNLTANIANGSRSTKTAPPHQGAERKQPSAKPGQCLERHLATPGRIEAKGVNRSNYGSLTLNKAPAQQGPQPVQQGDWSQPDRPRPRTPTAADPLKLAIGVGHPADPRQSLDNRGTPGTLAKQGKTLRDPYTGEQMSAEGIYTRGVARYFFERLEARDDVTVKFVHERNLEKQAQRVSTLEKQGFKYYELHANAAPGTSGVMVGHEITWLDVSLAQQLGAFSQAERQDYLIPSQGGTLLELRPLDAPTSATIQKAARQRRVGLLSELFQQDWKRFKRVLDTLGSKDLVQCMSH